MNNLEVFEDEIVEIEFFGEHETVDITVEEEHMFFCNDIYTHNSSTDKEIVKTEDMGGNLKKAQIAGIIFSVGKTLPQKENNTATITIIKNRYGDDGVVFQDCVFNNGLMHIETGVKLTTMGYENAESDKKDSKNKDRLREIVQNLNSN
jgi:hypothetical protein